MLAARHRNLRTHTESKPHVPTRHHYQRHPHTLADAWVYGRRDGAGGVSAQKINPRAGLHKAGMLELWLRFALFTLVRELGRLHKEGEDNAGHSDELKFLRQITGCFAALALLIAKMKREMEKRVSGFWTNGWRRRFDTGGPQIAWESLKLAYLDSS